MMHLFIMRSHGRQYVVKDASKDKGREPTLAEVVRIIPLTEEESEMTLNDLAVAYEFEMLENY